MKTERRSILKKLFASVAGVTGLGLVSSQTKALESAPEKEVGNVVNHQDVPLFSVHTKFNNLVFVAGKGVHFEGDITAHTKHVLDELEAERLKYNVSAFNKALYQVVKANREGTNWYKSHYECGPSPGTPLGYLAGGETSRYYIGLLDE